MTGPAGGPGRRVGWSAAILVVVLGVAAGVCIASTASPLGRLVDYGTVAGTRQTVALPATEGTPYVVGGMTVCVTGAPSAEIVSVRSARRSGPLRIDGVAVVTPADGNRTALETGAAATTLRALGVAGPTPVVRARCERGEAATLLLQLRRTAAGVAVADELLATYRIGGLTAEVLLSSSFLLCPGPTAVGCG